MISTAKYWKIIISALAAVLFLLVLIGFVSRWGFPDTNWDLSGNGEKIEVSKGNKIIQKFKAGRDNLSRIRILFGRSYNKDGGEINLRIFDENCENLIREKSFERSSIQSEGYYDFKFSKIADSKDNNFCLAIDFKPEKEKYKKLNVFLGSNSVSESQLLINDQEIKNSALAMRPAYQSDSFWGNVEELNQRISQYKPWFLKNIYLYAVFFLFILLTFFLAILFIWI